MRAAAEAKKKSKIDEEDPFEKDNRHGGDEKTEATATTWATSSQNPTTKQEAGGTTLSLTVTSSGETAFTALPENQTLNL